MLAYIMDNNSSSNGLNVDPRANNPEQYGLSNSNANAFHRQPALQPPTLPSQPQTMTTVNPTLQQSSQQVLYSQSQPHRLGQPLMYGSAVPSGNSPQTPQPVAGYSPIHGKDGVAGATEKVANQGRLANDEVSRSLDVERQQQQLQLHGIYGGDNEEYLPRQMYTAVQSLSPEQQLQKQQLQRHLSYSQTNPPPPPSLPTGVSPFLSTLAEHRQREVGQPPMKRSYDRLTDGSSLYNTNDSKKPKTSADNTATAAAASSPPTSNNDDIDAESFLPEHIRNQLNELTPPEAMRLKMTALFNAFPENTQYLASRFRKLVLQADKNLWDKYDPDELSRAFSVAVEKGSPAFWKSFKGDDQLMARLRNYLAFLHSKKRHGETPVLRGLAQIPVTTAQFERAKMTKVLQVFERKGTEASSSLASKILKSAIRSDEQDKRSPSPDIVEQKLVTKAAGGEKKSKDTTGKTSSSTSAGSMNSQKSDNTAKQASSTKAKHNSAATKTTATDSKSPGADLKTASSKPTPSSDSRTTGDTTKSTTSTSSGSGFFKSLQSAQSAQKTKPPAQQPTPTTSSTTTSARKTKASSEESSEAAHATVKPAEKPKLFSSGGFSVTGHLANIRKASHDGVETKSGRSESPTVERKKKKKVHWKDDVDLVEVRTFTPDPSEVPHKLRSFNDAKQMEYHEAIHNFDPEQDEEVTWREPPVIDIETAVPNKQYREALSIKRGGTKQPVQTEALAQQKREAHTMVVYYSSKVDIPPSPAEPPSSSSVSGAEPKIIPIAESLKSHPLVQQLKNPPPNNQPNVQSYESTINKIIGQTQSNGGNTNNVHHHHNNNNRRNTPPPPPPPPPPPIDDSTNQSLQDLLNKLGAITSGAANTTNQNYNRNASPTVSEGVMRERQRDVRQHVRQDTGNPEKYRMACKYFNIANPSSCRRGDECGFLHPQD
jgi:hypothetical protein